MPRAPSLLPFLSALLGIAAFSVMDAVMKHASLLYDVYTALLLRNLIGAALVCPAWLFAGGRWPKRAALTLHAGRSAVVVGMAYLFFSGLTRLPLAEAIALSFIAPLIAIYLSGLLLGEKVRLRSVLASLVGLVGVGVIAGARAASSAYDAQAMRGVIEVLASAVLYAVNLVAQRKQAQLAGPLEIAMFQNLLVGAFLMLGAWHFARWPTPELLRLSALAGALATGALMLLASAYARAEAQALVATEYTAFIWAALMGWLWFGEVVTWPTLAGVVLIVCACWITAPRRTEQTAL